MFYRFYYDHRVPNSRQTKRLKQNCQNIKIVLFHQRCSRIILCVLQFYIRVSTYCCNVLLQHSHHQMRTLYEFHSKPLQQHLRQRHMHSIHVGSNSLETIYDSNENGFQKWSSKRITFPMDKFMIHRIGTYEITINVNSQAYKNDMITSIIDVNINCRKWLTCSAIPNLIFSISLKVLTVMINDFETSQRNVLTLIIEL